MAGEYVGSVHVDALLSNLAVLYRPAFFIADQVAPFLPVVHESDLYPVFTQGDFYGTDVDDAVADRSEPKVVEFSHSNSRYQCVQRELAWEISDRERANADDQLRLDRNKQVGTLGRLLLLRELRVAAMLRKTTNTTTIGAQSIAGQLTNGAAAANDWGVNSTTTIESDIYTGIETIRENIGIRPNVIVIPFRVAINMQNNDRIRARIQYTYGNNAPPSDSQWPVANDQAGNADMANNSLNDRPMVSNLMAVLPPYFMGMKVLVPEVIENTASEGTTASYTDVWGTHVRLLYVTPGPAIEIPSVAYTFQSQPLFTRRARDDRRRLDWFAVGACWSEVCPAPLAGYEISSCTSQT
jgi:hypothetical protein